MALLSFARESCERGNHSPDESLNEPMSSSTVHVMSPTGNGQGTPLAATEIQPRDVQSWLAGGTCLLLDVREPDEFAREHVNGAVLMPLSRFDPRQITPNQGQRVVLMCRSGRRSGDALRRCHDLATQCEVVSMAGGIDAWKSAGLPVSTRAIAPRLGVLQQTQATIGLMTLTGLALAFWVHPAGLLLSAFMGCGLVLAGLTGFCPLASAIACLPWNRRSTQGNCSGGNCAGGSCRTK